MKRMRKMLGVFLIAAVLAAQPGCQYLMGKAAIEVGKRAYKKVTEDKDKNEPNKQPTSEPAKQE